MGLFLSMEGPDGSGKTLQMDLLQQELQVAGYPVLRTREPGGTQIGERIRDLLLDPECREMDAMTEALLYAASRAQHVRQTIRPALERGEIVLCDRYVDSSLIYQGIGRGLGVGQIAAINEYATGGLQPDMTIVLQIGYEEGLKRKNRQYDGRLDRMERQADEFHRRVHDGFSSLVQLDPGRVRMIDGGRTPQEVHILIMEALKPLLNRVQPR